MFPLFESIKIIEGQALHLSWHQERLNRSYFQLFGKESPFLLEKQLQVPLEAQSGIVKARFVYGKEKHYWEFHSYQPKEIYSLKVVTANKIDYGLKYADRKALNTLLSKTEAHQEIIIVKNGFVSDSSYSNLIFKSGETWFTPDTPLLAGTCRARLVSEQKITAIPIKKEDISSFSAVKLINAMLGPEDTFEIPSTSILY